jgi:predicted amidophosphoribosyltransferase
MGSMLCDPCARDADVAADGTCPEGVDRMLVRWAYADAPRSLVLDLKARAVRSAGLPLGRGIADLIRRRGCEASVLTWVPGRARENRVRGFDHAELIAREVGRRLGLPCVPLLHRRVDVVDQTGLSRADRRRNLVGAFGSGPVGGWVGLVDDVVTSGATAEVCAQSLKDAGAEGVELLAACRA